jgi:hypothetical protein
MKRLFSHIFKIAVVLLAIIGLAFTLVFFGERFNLFSVRGSISERNSFFGTITRAVPSNDRNVLFCRINVLSRYSPTTAARFFEAYGMTNDPKMIDTMLTLAAKRFSATSIIQEYNACNGMSANTNGAYRSAFVWAETPEWATLKGAFPKDFSVITQVSEETGVPTRLLVAAAMPEQMRFFASTRDIYKSYFEPLKILGTLSQFSLGVTGIKPETAVAIEQYAADPASPFYPGDGYSTLIAYTNEERSSVDPLYARLTDAHDHYYQYLYTAIFLRECIAEWQRAGYDISNDPGALITLFNLGFAKSVPKINPSVGGAPIAIGDRIYSFGELGEEFYYSGELADLFPYPKR